MLWRGNALYHSVTRLTVIESWRCLYEEWTPRRLACIQFRPERGDATMVADQRRIPNSAIAFGVAGGVQPVAVQPAAARLSPGCCTDVTGDTSRRLLTVGHQELAHGAGEHRLGNAGTLAPGTRPPVLVVRVVRARPVDSSHRIPAVQRRSAPSSSPRSRTTGRSAAIPRPCCLPGRTTPRGPWARRRPRRGVRRNTFKLIDKELPSA